MSSELSRMQEEIDYWQDEAETACDKLVRLARLSELYYSQIQELRQSLREMIELIRASDSEKDYSALLRAEELAWPDGDRNEADCG